MKEELLKDIESWQTDLDRELAAVATSKGLQDLKVSYLGRKGRLTEVLKSLKDLPAPDRPVVGQKINRLKGYLEGRLKDLSFQIEERSASQTASAGIDLTLPGRGEDPGHIHPLTKVIRQMEDIFLRLGFSIYEGPELETDYYNFEALNHPPDHPARDMQDTFYAGQEKLLRTHTSPVQIRVMEKFPPPIYAIGPGRVYRRDTPDLTHTPVFHQVEGLMVDRHITFGDLKGVLSEFMFRMFGSEIEVRFRPSFFPFTEPSAEMEISCVVCGGKGCRVCKESGWIEVLGCGMVDPNVFQCVGYDYNKYSGFAFGIGVERIAMLKYRIDDIRLFFENDLRFLRQF